MRALGTAMRRPAESYIAYFREIRQIHDYILESASRAGVQAVENLSIENTSDAAVEIVTNRVSGIADRAGRQASAMLLDAGTPRYGVPVTRAKSS
jgi:2-phosphoglycerate kinase